MYFQGELSLYTCRSHKEKEISNFYSTRHNTIEIVREARDTTFTKLKC